MKKITEFQHVFKTERFGVSGIFFLFILLFWSIGASAQGEARVTARISATQITVGDQVRLFIEAQNNPKEGSLQWAIIPDTTEHLEIIEKGKIDTITNGNFITYKQRLTITGFDSGLFQVPSFTFSVIPNGGGEPILLHSDSFQLLVQTVQVDTTKAFKPIKGIIFVKTTWVDYLIYIIIGGVIVLVLIVLAIYIQRKKKVISPKPPAPQEPLYDRTLRLLTELEEKQLWQKNKVKEYYVELTDIVRGYIEERFNTHALELTTDELLTKVQLTKDLQPYYTTLSIILHTADLAKFAKAQPLPQEHTEAMENAIQFVKSSKLIIIPISTETKTTI